LFKIFHFSTSANFETRIFLVTSKLATISLLNDVEVKTCGDNIFSEEKSSYWVYFF